VCTLKAQLAAVGIFGPEGNPTPGKPAAHEAARMPTEGWALNDNIDSECVSASSVDLPDGCCRRPLLGHLQRGQGTRHDNPQSRNIEGTLEGGLTYADAEPRPDHDVAGGHARQLAGLPGCG
jgi:hypothetical protein